MRRRSHSIQSAFVSFNTGERLLTASAAMAVESRGHPNNCTAVFVMRGDVTGDDPMDHVLLMILSASFVAGAWVIYQVTP
jgi:hypothetical protein